MVSLENETERVRPREMGQKCRGVSGKWDRNVVVALEITPDEAWDGAGSALQSPYLCYGWKITILNTYFWCTLLNFLGLQQLKEKPHDFSGLCKDSSSKSCSREPASLDPDVRLCQCVENTIIEIINMSVSGI